MGWCHFDPGSWDMRLLDPRCVTSGCFFCRCVVGWANSALGLLRGVTSSAVRLGLGLGLGLGGLKFRF